MEGFQFIDIIILAMVAGFIVLRLRSVLGRRTGHEPTRDPRPEEGYARGTANSPDNVVTIPGAAQRRNRENALDIEPAYQGTPMEAGLVQIKMADPSFSVSRFSEGAAKAFELIVNAYARGDTDTLKPLLSPEVYGQFANAIQDREQRGETMETELVVLKPPKVEAISVEGTRASIDVRFQSEQVNVIKNSAGEIVDGDREHVDSVTDVWTFARDLSSRDPNWVLVATRSVE